MCVDKVGGSLRDLWKHNGCLLCESTLIDAGVHTSKFSFSLVYRLLGMRIMLLIISTIGPAGSSWTEFLRMLPLSGVLMLVMYYRLRGLLISSLRS